MSNDQLADLLEEAARKLRAKSYTAISPHDTRLCVSAAEGARLLDVSKDTFERLRLASFKIGRLTRYRVQTIKDFIDRAAREE